MPITSTTSPPDSGFTPRKEFIREQGTPNSFALLAVAGSNCIRLYSFPQTVVVVFRKFLDQRHLVLAFHEEPSHGLCEFVLDGKPWANPKAVITEKLLIDILSLIYHCGYNYLSSIDYGRDNDDRLAIAFSKPAVGQSRSGTPASGSPHIDGSRSSFHEKGRNKRVPFALSFTSSTLMRVIAPPLHLTPAILQAVRGSWPRGVVSEKKVGENSFEFKLKGYKWFQQDTFAADSLRHILSLLTSLDTHSFTLLTSISLTNRSRVKDLWIFTGPASSEESILPDYLEVSILNGTQSDLRRKGHTPEASGSNQQLPRSGSPLNHRRLPAEPTVATQHHLLEPTKSGSEVTKERSQHTHSVNPAALSSPQILRKPAPRAQIPVSAIHDDEQENFRANLPSAVSNGVHDMTGVGAVGNSPNLYYTTSPLEATSVTGVPSPGIGSPPGRGWFPLGSEAAKAPPHSPLSHQERYQDSNPQQHEYEDQSSPSAPGVPPLLGLGTFRDSAFSSNSELSCEIPVKWAGIGGGDFSQHSQQDDKATRSTFHNNRASSGPVLPGGWQPSPIEEKNEDEDLRAGAEEECQQPQTTPIHEVGSRIDSPELIRPDMPPRKSEAAVVGMMSVVTESPAPAMPMMHGAPQRAQGTRKDSQVSPSGSGQGWVLVNVEGGNASSPSGTQAEHHSVSNISPVRFPELRSPEPQRVDVSISSGSNDIILPPVKTIAFVDAMDAKKRSKPVREGTSAGGVRRFFSLSRKNSKKELDEDLDLSRRKDKDHHGGGGDKSSNMIIPRSGLRDRLRLLGTPEASRREDKRRSIE